jgi:HPt (histidine-containing phosphotransfer) domain-containing protein
MIQERVLMGPDHRPDHTHQVLDETAPLRLFRSFGADGPTMLRDVVTAFLSEAPESIATLNQALRQRDPATACRAAFTLRTGAATLGAGRLEAAACEVEHRLAHGDLAGADDALAALEREYAPAATALRDLAGRVVR